MSTQEAVAQRITQLCNERRIAINSLAMSAQVSPSTIYKRSVLRIFFAQKMKKKHASAVSFGWRQRRLSATISNRVSG